MSTTQARDERASTDPYRLFPENIPDELKALDHWVLWRMETVDGKPTKVPYQARTDWHQRRASVTDPRTWATWPAAYALAQKHHIGVGIVLDGSEDLYAVDLDAKPELSQDAERILGQCHSYTECSPSGKGRRIFLKGALPDGFTGARRKDVEVYRTGRYLTVTGDRINGHTHILQDQPTTDLILSLTKPTISASPEDWPATDTEGPESWELSLTRNDTGDESADDHAFIKDLLRLHPDGDWAWRVLQDFAPREKLEREDYRRRTILRAWAEVKAEKSVVKEALQTIEGEAQARVPFSLKRMLDEVPAPFWLIDGVMMQGHITALLGAPNAGKTGVAVDMALHLATGRPLGPRKVVRRRVMYVGVENPEDVALRIRAWCLQHSVNPDELEDWFYFLPKAVDICKPEVVLALGSAIKGRLGNDPLGLLVLDTFSSLFSGESENDATEVMAFFNNLRNHVVSPLRCTALVLHHPPKNSTNLHDWRGSSAALGTLDNIWGAEVLDDGSIVVSQGKRRGPPFPDLHWQNTLRSIPGVVDNFGHVVKAPLMLMESDSPDAPHTYTVPQHWVSFLQMLKANRDASLRALGAVSGLENPHPQKIKRELMKMKKANLIVETKDGWRLSPDGNDVLQNAVTTPVTVGDTA